MKENVKKVMKVLMMLLILGTTTVGMVFSIIGFNKINDVEKQNVEIANKVQLKEEEELEEKEKNEEIVIGDVYKIISTEAISDAYISGDDSKLSEEDKVTLEVASKVIEEIIEEDMTDYEKEEAIYVWICENIENDTGGTVAVPSARGIYDRPYGVLQNKQAVCVGYATTFKLLTNMVGLDCLVMHDIALSHSWNLIQLDDGCWYMVDCYMDAGDMLYANFNMNDEMASYGHDWAVGEYPVANGVKYNYLEMSKIKVADVEEMIEQIAKFYEDEKSFGVIEVPIKEDITYEQIQYVADGVAYRLTNEFSDAYLQVLEGSSEEVVLVAYCYYNYEDMDDGDYSDEDFIWIDEILDDTFGEGENWEDEYYEEEYYEDIEVEIYKEY